MAFCTVFICFIWNLFQLSSCHCSHSMYLMHNFRTLVPPRLQLSYLWNIPLNKWQKPCIALLNTHCLFSGPLEYNRWTLEKLSFLLSFFSIQLLCSKGPLNKQWVLSNVQLFHGLNGWCEHSNYVRKLSLAGRGLGCKVTSIWCLTFTSTLGYPNYTIYGI